MAFTKLQGATPDTIGAVLRGFGEDDWRAAKAWLDEVLTTHGDEPNAYTRVLEMSGVDMTGVTDANWAGYGLATRIRERADND